MKDEGPFYEKGRIHAQFKWGRSRVGLDNSRKATNDTGSAIPILSVQSQSTNKKYTFCETHVKELVKVNVLPVGGKILNNLMQLS